MDAGVVSNFRPQAFASRTAAERFCYRGKATVLLETLGCRSQGDRRSRKARGSVCGVAAPPRCTEASPSSRLLASDPTALATPPHTLFQQPARTLVIVENLQGIRSERDRCVRFPGVVRAATALVPGP